MGDLGLGFGTVFTAASGFVNLAPPPVAARDLGSLGGGGVLFPPRVGEAPPADDPDDDLLHFPSDGDLGEETAGDGGALGEGEGESRGDAAADEDADFSSDAFFSLAPFSFSLRRFASSFSFSFSFFSCAFSIRSRSARAAVIAEMAATAESAPLSATGEDGSRGGESFASRVESGLSFAAGDVEDATAGGVPGETSRGAI